MLCFLTRQGDNQTPSSFNYCSIVAPKYVCFILFSIIYVVLSSVHIHIWQNWLIDKLPTTSIYFSNFRSRGKSQMCSYFSRLDHLTLRSLTWSVVYYMLRSRQILNIDSLHIKWWIDFGLAKNQVINLKGKMFSRWMKDNKKTVCGIRCVESYIPAWCCMRQTIFTWPQRYKIEDWYQLFHFNNLESRRDLSKYGKLWRRQCYWYYENVDVVDFMMQQIMVLQMYCLRYGKHCWQ